MIKNIKHIEIVRTSLKEFSSMSLESAEAILEVLEAHYESVSIFEVNNRNDLSRLIDIHPDLVFLGMEYIIENDEKIWLTSSLATADIDFTGSSKIAHYLERNKDLAKGEVLKAGLKTSPYILAKQTEYLDLAKLELRFPLFIKPANRGGGLGIDGTSKIYNIDQLKFKIADIAKRYKSDALIEQFLPGREFSVAVLRRSNSNDYDVMPIELIAPKDETGLQILSSKVKTANSEVVMLVGDQELFNSVTELAINCFKALSAKDYGRIDIRVDADGEVNFLEANLLPSLISGYGSFPKASLMNNDLSHEEIILRIVELAAETENLYIEEPLGTVLSPSVNVETTILA
jgi:D-alanine-D-alanine ligase